MSLATAPLSARATSQQPVFIALQANNDTLPIVQAVEADNPQATVDEMPGMVKITAPGRLRICRHTVEAHLGRDFDLRELHIHLISLAGEIDETDEEFSLQWRAA